MAMQESSIPRSPIPRRPKPANNRVIPVRSGKNVNIVPRPNRPIIKLTNPTNEVLSCSKKNFSSFIKLFFSEFIQL